MTITDAMAQVVSPVGTAPSARLQGIDFAGKTGSAQTISNDLKKKVSAPKGSILKDNGWFVGVTPRRNPEIVVAVLLEEGEHGILRRSRRCAGDQGVRRESSELGKRKSPKRTRAVSKQGGGCCGLA